MGIQVLHATTAARIIAVDPRESSLDLAKRSGADVVLAPGETLAAAVRDATGGIGADVVLMAKAVDGVFTEDPRQNPDAEMLTSISHREVIDRGLRVADATAFSLCMDNGMPILVFNLLTDGNIARAVSGEKIGTLVSNGSNP